MSVVTLEDFLRGLMPTHQVWARKYASASTPEQAAQPSAFFVVAVPKGIVLGQGLVHSIAGDVGASLVEATRGK